LFLSSGADGIYFTSNFIAEPVWLFKFHYVPQAWSLPIELAFYAMAPWLVHSPRRLLGLGLVSFIAKYATLAQVGPVDPWYYRFAPFELWLFCLGALVWHAVPALKGRVERLGWPLLITMVIFTLGYEWANPQPAWAVDAPRYFVYLAMLAVALPVLFLAFGKARWDRALGELSYPIYLVHLLVIGVVQTFGWRLAGDASLLIVAGSLLAGAVLAFGLGLPLERRYKREACAAEIPRQGRADPV
jgi:peptidoglycan/LPS O-acetylase OafA/YrhL